MNSKVRVNLPPSLPDWINPIWKDELLKVDLKEVKISSGLHNHDFFEVGVRSCITIFTGNPIRPGIFLLHGWYQSINGPIACDCSMPRILAVGCKNKNHF